MVALDSPKAYEKTHIFRMQNVALKQASSYSNRTPFAPQTHLMKQTTANSTNKLYAFCLVSHCRVVQTSNSGCLASEGGI